MKTKIATVLFLLTLSTVVASGCSFDSVTNLIATPTPTSTNTPLPTFTPTITLTPAPTSTSTPSPTPAPSWNPGVTYDNDKFGFSIVFPNGTEIEPMELTDGSGLPPEWAGLTYSFMIGKAGPAGIIGFSSKNGNLLPKPMEDIIATVASNLPEKQIFTSTFSNTHAVEIGRIDAVQTDGRSSTAIYFKSNHVLIYFTFTYNNAADKQSAETIISGSVDTIQLK